MSRKRASKDSGKTKASSRSKQDRESAASRRASIGKSNTKTKTKTKSNAKAPAKRRAGPGDHRAPPSDLVIAVTGHRKFSKGDAPVAALVRAEMERLARRFPDAPAVVITALAEGADRMVADIAREVLGARVHVSLPMPAEAYEMDFADAASKRRFRAMVKRADEVVTGPILSKGRAWRSWTEERNHQYAWGGAYVAANADVLFAVWDGKPARGTGGTAHVVGWFLEGATPRRYGMSRWKLARGERAPAGRSLVHVNPETLTVKRRRAAG